MGACNNPNCTYSLDGKCLRGNEPVNCEFFSTPDQSDPFSQIIGDLQAPQNLPTKKAVPFEIGYSGFELNSSEAIEINTPSLPHVVVLAGRLDVGKTTLIATLASQFQQNSSFANYRFCSSKTLLGFEKRCFLSRIESGRVKEDTERTPLSSEGYKFLHLGIAEIRNRLNRIDLLIADIPGEEFKNIANSSEKANSFHLAKRADHFAFLVDADLLSNKKDRQSEKNFLKNLFQRFADTGMLDQSINVQIVFTKWDLLLSKDEQENHLSFVNGVEEEIRLRSKGSEEKIDFIKLASRSSTKAKVKAGWGFDELLAHWVSKPPRKVKIPSKHPVSLPADAREFCLYEYHKS